MDINNFFFFFFLHPKNKWKIDWVLALELERSRKYKCRKSTGYLNETFGNLTYKWKRKGDEKIASIIFTEVWVHFWKRALYELLRFQSVKQPLIFKSLCCHLSINEIPITYRKRLWDQLTEELPLWIMFPELSFY